MTHALVVANDDAVRSTITDNIERRGISTSEARSIEQAREQLRRRRPDVLVIGCFLPREDVQQLADLTEPNRPRIILMNHTMAEERMIQRIPSNGNGHEDGNGQGLDSHLLNRLLDEVEQSGRDRDEAGEDAGRAVVTINGMVGRSEVMHRVWHTIRKVAPTDATVLIVGESGTGKELVAGAIHQCSPRRDRPFVVLNCGAIPDNLIDSELFGHEKGAFTGATRARSGVFERADGGTLFLDEIAEMPIDLQTRLLRVLETGRLRRVGGEREIDVDCRVVAATNRSASEAVEEGKLREDLFYRLSVFPIRIPPLRRREQDIEVLALHFLEELNNQFRQAKRFTPDAMEMMRTFHWPGNVRQLRNAIHRAFILADSDVIHSGMIPRHNGTKPRGEDGPAVSLPIGTSIAEAEQKLIAATLEHYQGNKKKTAKVLGVSLRTLYNRLNGYEPGSEPST
jgi:two-component system, NtrC family, response regulator AtoC